MIKLSKVRVNKYKSIISPQVVTIEKDVTTLVGMNEAGKTAFLEAMAKFNYFETDESFKFNTTKDFPRRELKKYQRDSEKVSVVECTYTISSKTLDQIAKDIGIGVFTNTEFSVFIHYGGDKKTVSGITVNTTKFKEIKAKEYELDELEEQKLLNLKSLMEIDSLINEESTEKLTNLVFNIKTTIINKYSGEWSNPLERYVYNKWLGPNIPKFWYYDEYFSLPSRINLNQLQISQQEDPSFKTAKALLDVSRIDINDILNANDFEDFIAELEATSNEITDHIFEYWTANKNLGIEFNLDSLAGQKILDIRVKNHKHRVSLPLNQRSKGFNWFFSFIIWFSKIRNDGNSNYILLLDEPGLNLHASAQSDLLRFIEDLAEDYQIIYSTHSPFMIDSTKLHRVRTVYEGDNGTSISESIQEKDNNTLFPLQAALGYEIAQNLFVSKNNLLVEGPADLLYLTQMSELLKQGGREGLNEEIVIVPVGGLDKIPAFISLMTGNKLNIVALLDSFNGPKGKQKLDDLTTRKIISEKKIRFFDEFIDGVEQADIEDLFTKVEYLQFYNSAYPNEQVSFEDITDKQVRIITQINQVIKKKRFNHYLPAREFLKLGFTSDFFDKGTLLRFEMMFKVINILFN